MRKVLYFIRHGRTDWNDLKAFMGQKIDVSLNQEGIRQVKELAQHFPCPAQKILYSPLKRARETVEILTGSWQCEAEVDSNLIEVNFGEWTGKKEEEVVSTLEFKRYLKDPETNPPPGGETMKEVQARVLKSIQKALAFHESPVALVAHMDVIRAALCSFLGKSLKNAFSFHIHTASLSAVKVGERTPVVLVNWIPPSVVDYFKS